MPDPLPRIRPATVDDLPEINRIYNWEVLHGIATWDVEPWSLAQREAWFHEHGPDMPVLVAEGPEGGAPGLVGFACLSLHRPKAGYRFTREDTLYIAPAFQRRGIGRALLGALIAEARRLGIHVVTAWIESNNTASIALHSRLGFELVGREHETGAKFGSWLSNVEMQLILDPAPREVF